MDSLVAGNDADLGDLVPATVAAGCASSVAGCDQLPQHRHINGLDHRHLHRFGVVGEATTRKARSSRPVPLSEVPHRRSHSDANEYRHTLSATRIALPRVRRMQRRRRSLPAPSHAGRSGAAHRSRATTAGSGPTTQSFVSRSRRSNPPHRCA
jgi:hypothetical protein